MNAHSNHMCLELNMYSASSRLPPEMHDYILDHLWDNRRALTNCSLTCRTWLPTTRFHLFRSISLASCGEYAQLEHLLDDCPGISHYVRTLLICNANHVTRMNRGLTGILLKLQNVEHLTLKSWRAYQMSNETRKTLEKCFPKVKTLILDECQFREHDLLHIILACPRLSAIHLVSSSYLPGATVSVPSLALIPADIPAPEIEIDTLVWSFSPDNIIAWLLDGAVKLRLRELHMAFVHSNRLEPENVAQKLLRAAGPSLQRLSISALAGLSDSIASYHALSLASNPNLEWLQLKGIILDGDRAIHFSRILCCTLAQIQPFHTQLRQIRIELMLTYVFDLPALELEKIDQVVAGLVEGRPDLEVVFHIRDGMFYSCGYDFHRWAREVSDAISSRLPVLKKSRDRLHIECAEAASPHAIQRTSVKSSEQIAFRYYNV